MRTTTVHQLLNWARITLFPKPRGAELRLGDTAPGFQLLDQYGISHKLSNYRGQWVVLYFYPKDNTPGCNSEACEFRDDVLMLLRMGVVLLGVSTDDVKSHQEFAEKNHLPFLLLSDARGDVARQYGSLVSLGPLKFAKRHTFVIDPDSRIAKIYRNVQSKQHSDQIIADLEELRALQTHQDPAPE